MEKRALLLAVVVVVLCGSAALALDPLGPPTAGLKEGQFRVGIEYFYETSEVQLGGDEGYFAEFNLVVKVKEHMVTGNIGYGINDNWEVFARVGAEVEGEGTLQLLVPESITFEGDESFVFGGGTKVTFYEQGKAKLGALFQINWGDSDGDIMEEGDTVASADIETLEWSVAIGPSYQLTETASIYGGPFLYFLDGDLEIEGDKGDIEESSSAGGYIGVQVDLSEDTSFNVEWLHTHDADALAMMYAWKF